MEDNSSARQRIILAAIDILNMEGASGITTRRIAEEASVNSAAVNYYFGSRDILIDQVLNITLEHAFSDWRMILEVEEFDLPIRIYCLLYYTMEGISMYPGIVHSHLFDSSVKEVRRRVFAERIDSLLDMLSTRLEERTPQTGEELRLSLGQMLLTAISAAMIPELLLVITKDDIAAAQARSRFILHLMKRLLGIELVITDTIQNDINRLLAMAFTSEHQNSY